VEGRAGYRRVVAEYAPFAADLASPPNLPVDRRRLTMAVTTYLARQGLATDFAKLEKASDAELVTNLAMAAPLSPEEKQAILEVATVQDRASLMIALFEMALLTESGEALLH